LPEVEVVGVVASTPESTATAARSLGLPQTFDSVDALIDSEDVEVVHNCTPNHLHLEVNRAALSAGKHLLSEKPLGMSAAETEELAGLAQASDVVTGLCHNYRHYPLVAQMRSMLASADYGTPHLVHGAYLQDWLLHKDDWNWRLDPAKGGRARAVADIGSHWLDLVQFVTGADVTSVCASFGRLHAERQKPASETKTFGASSAGGEMVPMGTEDSATVLLAFSNGAAGSMTVSQVSPGRKNALTVEVDTDVAALAWNQEDPNHLWIGRRDAANSDLMRDASLLDADAAPLAHYPGGHEEGWADGLKNLMIDFYASVGAHREGRVRSGSFATFAEGHRLMRLVEAVVESDRTRTWIDVEGDSR
jgi:predicted dehydrogenase